MTGTAYAVDRPDNGADTAKAWPLVELMLLALVLALLQVAVAGYATGVGNQTIQIPYLLHLMDPQLFAADPAIAGTIERYPSWCYQLLAPICSWLGITATFVMLHLLSGWALFLALLVMARRWWGSAWPGLVAGLMLSGGHLHGVAGGDTYVAGFTHTWLALPWALWAIYAAWERRWLVAGLLLGGLFDIHALMAGYATLLAVAGALAERRRGDLRILGLAAAVAVVAAAPTLIHLLGNRAPVDERWFALMFARSSHHSFPLELWTTGESAIPRLALVLGLATAALSLVEDPALRRRALGLGLAFGVLLLVGALGTASATVLKAQLWRSSALVIPLALLPIAHACLAAWRVPGFGGRAVGAAFACAALVLAVPALTPLRWFALTIVSAAVIAAGLLSWRQALVVGAAHAVMIAAAIQLQLPLLGLPSRSGGPESGALALAAVLVLLVLLARRWWPALDHLPRLQRSALALGLLLLAALHIGPRLHPPGDDWTRLQVWVRDHTPVAAVILTPLQRSGFRIHSQRSVVSEWRDGTQLYFDPAFASTWWQRVEAVQPGIAYSDDGRLREAPGLPYAALDDAALVELCTRLGADHLVLPAERSTALVPAVTIGDWQLCRAELPPPPPRPAAEDGSDAARERFLAEVVEPNIQRHRRGRLELELRDATGRALKDLAYELVQVEHAFGFGCSLDHFVSPPKRRIHGFTAPVHAPGQLDLFRGIFNYSIIAYSGKWAGLEPEPGQRFYADLDAYLAWCEQQRVVPEYHFVTGYMPEWLKDRPREEKRERLLAHTADLIKRYGDRIPAWQVVNEKILLRESPEVFKLFRKHLPQAKLGISDCARFYSDKPHGSAKRERDLLRGMDEVRWLREQGVELDFFAVHAHRPFGLWADLEETYRTLDAFAAEGLRIHISEFGIHENHQITGDTRDGHWNEDLQAEYYELIFRVLYSHPAVDVINLWGFTGETWMTGAGLLDRKGQPKEAYQRLKRLITGEWRSRHSGTLPLTGSIATNGFHGDYELRLDLADGSQRVIPLAHRKGDQRYRITLDLDDPSATRVEPR